MKIFRSADVSPAMEIWMRLVPLVLSHFRRGLCQRDDRRDPRRDR
jgi:hypothetical protein